MTANHFSVPAGRTVGLSVRWVLMLLFGWAGAGHLHALVPARASAPEVHGGVTQSFPASLPQDRFGLKNIKFLHLGQILQKMHLNSSSVQPLPMQLPCCLAEPRARSIVKYLQPESLKAEFQCLSPRSSAPIEGVFLSQWYFPDKLTKDLFNFFSNNALLSMFILA